MAVHSPRVRSTPHSGHSPAPLGKRLPLQDCAQALPARCGLRNFASDNPCVTARSMAGFDMLGKVALAMVSHFRAQAVVAVRRSARAHPGRGQIGPEVRLPVEFNSGRRTRQCRRAERFWSSAKKKLGNCAGSRRAISMARTEAEAGAATCCRVISVNSPDLPGDTGPDPPLKMNKNFPK